MILKAFSLLDVKTGLFSAPWFLNHKAVAVRAVRELGRDMGTNVGKYPADFVLYQLGEFDDCAGVLITLAPDMLGSVAALIAQEG